MTTLEKLIFSKWKKRDKSSRAIATQMIEGEINIQKKRMIEELSSLVSYLYVINIVEYKVYKIIL